MVLPTKKPQVLGKAEGQLSGRIAPNYVGKCLAQHFQLVLAGGKLFHQKRARLEGSLSRLFACSFPSSLQSKTKLVSASISISGAVA